MRKIYVVGGAREYANWMQGEIVNRIEDSDLVVFTGGEDVTPSFYGEPAHPRTSCNPKRDAREQMWFAEAFGMGKKMVGICRGAQFLCVMSGGKLVQDQELQPGYHWMHTIDGDEILVSSTHHQAQWPWNLKEDEFKVLGWTANLSGWHENGHGDEIVKSVEVYDGRGDRPEVEVCKYPKIRALGIQPHPEYYFNSNHPDHIKSIEWFQKLLNAHMEE